MKKNALTDGLGRIIRSFSLHSDESVHFPSYGIRNWIPFERSGVVANTEYKFEIPEDVELGRMVLLFDIGANPSGKVTLKIYSINSVTAEVSAEFNMNANLINNAFTVDLSTVFPPIRGNKIGSFTTTVNCKGFQLFALPCYIDSPVTNL